MKAVLHASGQGAIHPIEEGESADESPDLTPLRNLMRDLNFIAEFDDPLVPALAKFYYVNQLDAFPVWPAELAFQHARKLVAQEHRRPWVCNPSDIAFVLRRAVYKKLSKSRLGEFGTHTCGEIVRGGGPFIEHDSEFLADKILRRLGFLDDDENADFVEALDVFFSLKLNRRILKELRIPLELLPGESARRAAMRGIFLSPRTHGIWQVCSADPGLQLPHALANQGLLRSPDASAEDLRKALNDYVELHDLPAKATYNALCRVVHQHLHRDDPSRRD